MNNAQELWWKQARSDFGVFQMMRSTGVHPCHTLHYLQMATEKIAKASFWSRNTAPALRHIGFVSFLRRLNCIPSGRRRQIASIFGFPNFSSFEAWVPTATIIGREIEKISPAVMPDGPNSEYPWPHAEPTQYPAGYEFRLWNDLQLSQGRRMMRFIERAVMSFPVYADI